MRGNISFWKLRCFIAVYCHQNWQQQLALDYIIATIDCISRATSVVGKVALFHQFCSFNSNLFLLDKKLSGNAKYWQWLTLFLPNGKLKVLAKNSFQGAPNYWHICEYLRKIGGHYWQIFKNTDDKIWQFFIILSHFLPISIILCRKLL